MWLQVLCSCFYVVLLYMHLTCTLYILKTNLFTYGLRTLLSFPKTPRGTMTEMKFEFLPLTAISRCPSSFIPLLNASSQEIAKQPISEKHDNVGLLTTYNSSKTQLTYKPGWQKLISNRELSKVNISHPLRAILSFVCKLMIMYVED